MSIQHTLWRDIEAELQNKQNSAFSRLTLSPATRPQFGEYQLNGLHSVAQQQGCAPETAATAVLEILLSAHFIWLQRAYLSGPGFISLELNPEWMAAQLPLVDTERQQSKQTQQRVVIDYSGPNIAKAMAMHHIRSTVIGDAVVRVLDHLGDEVIRANHIGDWGTQFGMLLAWTEQHPIAEASLASIEAAYTEARAQYDADPHFAQLARAKVVALQQGDPETNRQWKAMVAVSLEHIQKIYDRLHITLQPSDAMGESVYNSLLPQMISTLKEKNLTQTLQGAVIVPLQGSQNKQGETMGMIVQKKDGGYLYATTDLACVHYRCQHLNADRLLYYVDARQVQHFQQVWQVARTMGSLPEHVDVAVHAFGMMLDNTGAPFKTRKGGTPALESIIEEAVARAKRLLLEKSPHLSPQAQEEVAETIAIGAIKYNDLQRHRLTHYRFDLDAALSFQGNTAPYLLYAYTRCGALLRKASGVITPAVTLLTPIERQLAMQLLKWSEVLEQVAREGLPHLLCQHLYQLASLFSRFYEACPILSAPSDQSNDRLYLTTLTRNQLKQGMGLLGLPLLERM